jgi:hypothetical protein
VPNSWSDIAAGLLHLLEGPHAAWHNASRAELEGLPKAPHDDRVDYLSQCLDHFREPEVDWARLFRECRERLRTGVSVQQ